MDTTENTIDRLFIMVWTDEIDRVKDTGFTLDDANYRMLVNKPLYAAGLAKMVGGLRINGLDEVELNGKMMSVPSFDKFNSVFVVSIDIDKIDASALVKEELTSSFYPEDMVMFRYPYAIGADAVLGAEEIKLSSPDVPMSP